MQVGEKIRLARVSKGITQENLAQRSGLSRNTIVNYETGKRIPRTDDLVKIAKVIDVDVSEFFETNPTLPPKTGGDQQ